MFFLIPLAIAAVSTISAGSIATGAAVAVTAGAFAAKKIADAVEEDNCRVVENAKKDARKYVKQVQTNAQKEKDNYKAKKIQQITQQLTDCDMKKKDKDVCMTYISGLNNKRIGE